MIPLPSFNLKIFPGRHPLHIISNCLILKTTTAFLLYQSYNDLHLYLKLVILLLTIPHQFLEHLLTTTLHSLLNHLIVIIVIGLFSTLLACSHYHSFYCPIPLTSCICKTLECMINDSLICFLETQYIIITHSKWFSWKSWFYWSSCLIIKLHLRSFCWYLKERVVIVFDLFSRYGCSPR